MDPLDSAKDVNYIYNHNFIYGNETANFPDGWHRGRGYKTAGFYWEKDDKDNYCLKIKNRTNRLASICQQHPYKIPVFERQVWEIGAIFKVYKRCSATIIVHFLSCSVTRFLSTNLSFILDPEQVYYYGIVTIPVDIEFAYIETGIADVGTVLIEDIVFRRIYPVDHYDMDAQGKLNINQVCAVREIIEPVKVQGMIEVVSKSIDVREDHTAVPELNYSRVQDVLYLKNYSFIVLNFGPGPVTVQPQMSPDSISWTNEGLLKEIISPNALKIFVYNCFTRYVRLEFQTEHLNTSDIRVFFQGQG